MRHITLTALVAALTLCSCVAKKPLYYPPVRWMRDNDRKPIEMPKVNEKELQVSSVDSQTYQQLEGVMATSGAVGAELKAVASGGKQEALDVNNFGEVVDSTWFENRIGRGGMTRAELLREALEEGSPAPGGQLTISAGKTQGRVPRLVVRDVKGHEYLLRFEPPGLRGIAIGAETVSAMILNAAGYHVPHDHMIELDARRLVLGKGAKTRGKYGDIRGMTEEDLRIIRQKITGGNVARIRAVASRVDGGIYMGPFSFTGRRYGDTNDVIPHQHRRELRGYKVFCSLLNMTRPSGARTADMFIPVEGDRGYIMHYIYDFGSAFGGAGSWDKLPDPSEFEGENYVGAIANMFTLGLRDDDDGRVKDEFGFLDAGNFKPGSWSPSIPNEAFAYMTRRDAFWAARIIMLFTDDEIDAVVDMSGFEDERIRRYVARSLKARRDKIGKHWFQKVNPLDNFVVGGASGAHAITFDDLAVDYGFRTADETEYRHMLVSRFGRAELSPWERTRSTEALLGRDLVGEMDPKRVYVLKLQTKRAGDKWWSSSVDLYIQRKGGGMKILGLERRYGNH